MAISETSKAPSRTIGLKPLLVGEYSAKSSVTRSDLIEPFFSAKVPGWAPSKVRKCIVISIGQGFIEIDKARLLQRLAHIVHVEPGHASGKLLARPVTPRALKFSQRGPRHRSRSPGIRRRMDMP